MATDLFPAYIQSMTRYVILLFLMPLILVAACSDADSDPAARSPAAEAATSTRPPGSASPRPLATFPRVDGTVDPLGFGGTGPVTVKAFDGPITGIATLRDVRVGAHPEAGGWDRIVFEFADVLPVATIRYEIAATQCGSGMNVALPGDAILVVGFEPANAHDDAGRPTIQSTRIAGPGGVILEAHLICDFEAHVDWAIGLRSRQRFKVAGLANPTRLVIDVKH